MTTKYYERIREVREDFGLSQTAVAKLLNVSQRTYSDYESGKTRIPLESVIILARHYNLSMDYMTGVSSRMIPFPDN
ncbi:helix-turn-helix domain-containing protein [Faecalibaculum rodentium]|uniref:helix-turn-helix domain-containing protein n=1 Tax=Faecalibaculum rodentium TaxID=1702221 RepID=UPI0023F37551|nr:helix-turn-helix transcriptional regulator [Faecalibaculum rodentium]